MAGSRAREETRSSLIKAISSLTAGTIVKRQEGLDVIRTSLKALGDSSNSKLKDEDWKAVLEALFDTTDSCKASINGSKGASQKKAVDQIGGIATALREIIEASHSQLDPETALDVLDHVSSLLEDDSFSVDTVNSMVKAPYMHVFRKILTVSSHVDHLRAKEWYALIEFVLNQISSNLQDIEQDIEAATEEALQKPASFTASARSTSSFHVSQSSSTRLNSSILRNRQLPSELVESLQLLTCATNCPLHTIIDKVADVVLSMLKHTIRVSTKPDTVRCAAFATLNNVILVSLTENVKLTRMISAVILELAERSWLGFGDAKGLKCREQVLISLMLLRRCLDQNLASNQPDDGITDVDRVDGLLAIYASESDVESIQLHEVSLTSFAEDHLFNRAGITPNMESDLTMVRWTSAAILSQLRHTKLQAHPSPSTAQENGDGPRKRRKVVASLPERASLLFLDGETISVQSCQDFLTRHATSISDDRDGLSSWTLLTIGRLCKADAGKHTDLGRLWAQVWTTVSQLVSSTANSRAACFAMMAMLDAGVVDQTLSGTDLIGACFSGASHGPPSISDGALLLFSSALRSSLLSTDAQRGEMRSKIISWLGLRWQLPTAKDQIRVSQAELNLRANLLAELFRDMLGEQCATTILPLHPYNAIRYAHVRANEDGKFARYLIDPASLQWTTDSSPAKEASPICNINSQSRKMSVQQLCQLLTILLTTFNTKSQEEQQSDQPASSAISRKLSVSIRPSLESMQILASACSIGTVMADRADNTDLRQVVLVSWQHVITFLEKSCEEIADFEHSFSMVVRSILPCHALSSTSQLSVWLHIIDTLQSTVSKRLASKPTKSGKMGASNNSIRSQHTQSQSEQVHQIIRSSSEMSVNGHDVFIETYAALLTNRSTVMSDGFKQADSLISWAISLVGIDFMSVKRVLLQYVQNESQLCVKDVKDLLGYIADEILDAPESERNEAALCFSCDILRYTMPVWVNTDDNELQQDALAVYNWYIAKPLRKKFASCKLFYHIALMLDSLLEMQQRLSGDSASSIQSPRTSLLQILSQPLAKLKYKVVSSVSKIFAGYRLNQHVDIFRDLVTYLPGGMDMEHAAATVYVLSKLGSQWPSILTQCIFAVFETAACETPTVEHAHQCLFMLGRTIGLKDAAAVFHLFAAPTMSEWLMTSTLTSVPFKAFGYESLRDLVAAEEEELVASTLFHDKPNFIPELQAMLEDNIGNLVTRNFSKALVYAIMVDTTKHKSGAASGPSETRLRSFVGSDNVRKLAKLHFTEAISQTIILLASDRGFEDILKVMEGQKHTSKIYSTMLRRASSDADLLASQETSIRAKYLIPVLSKICLIAGQDIQRFWSAPLLTHVYRRVLDSADKALGPLHAASAVRNLRVVIALAGPTALQGYPLEMLLHNLQPFISSFHSSQDTLGIYWYLIDQGKQHLQKNIPFMTGLVVAIFTSLSSFVLSSQDSTTQETQFRAKISRAREFRDWLCTYLSTFKPSAVAADIVDKFHGIVKEATRISKACSNNIHEPEGNLLRNVLLDQASTSPVLSKTFFDSIIYTLSQDFQLHAIPAEDIFDREEDCVLVAPLLHRAIAEYRLAEPFVVWVGSTLGRAYAISGPKSLPSIEDGISNVFEESPNLDATRSYQLILQQLADKLWTQDKMLASNAERTLSDALTFMPRQQRELMLESLQVVTTLENLVFHSVAPQTKSPIPLSTRDESAVLHCEAFERQSQWSAKLAELLISKQDKNSFLRPLTGILKLHPDIGAKALPMIIHLTLFQEREQRTDVLRSTISSVLDQALNEVSSEKPSYAQTAVDVLLYLRRCILPGEKTQADRHAWLSIDWQKAIRAALSGRRFTDALLLFEVEQIDQIMESNRSKRSSTRSATGNILNYDMLDQIFRSVPDADHFYGTHQEDSISAMVSRLKHEKDGQHLLSLESALLDSRAKVSGLQNAYKDLSIDAIDALAIANLDSIAHSTSQHMCSNGRADMPSLNQSLVNIHEWDVSMSRNMASDTDILRSVLHAIETYSEPRIMEELIHSGLLATTKIVSTIHNASISKSHAMSTLTALSEASRLLSTRSTDDLQKCWKNILQHRDWNDGVGLDNLKALLTSRESFAAALKRNSAIRKHFHTTEADLLLHEIHAVRYSLHVAIKHDIPQFCLGHATHLSMLENVADTKGLVVKDAIVLDIANTLWSQGQIGAPISMLRSLERSSTLETGDLSVSKAELLTSLGQKLGKARLERPDEVTDRYLKQSISDLKHPRRDPAAGLVYHNFAAFCDEQLQDQNGKDDFERITKLRDQKLDEVTDLSNMTAASSSAKEVAYLKAHYLNKAKRWLQMDQEEYDRIRVHRERLLQYSLENYLLSMLVCDTYNKDILRFLSLWLSHSEISEANAAVKKYLPELPTIKIAPFINQLCSRLQESNDKFPRLLSDLLYRLCCDHPYHAQYQLFATYRTKSATHDKMAESRKEAAKNITTRVHKSSGMPSNIWVAVHNVGMSLSTFAHQNPPETKKVKKFKIKDINYGERLQHTLQTTSQKVPPPTLEIQLRADKDYSSLPTFTQFEPEFSLAGGVSAPKILDIIGSDGKKYKMLLKGGNDDLRQDAIMEQVFAQVSDVLKADRATRQRNLGIRTYKVVPLSHNTGIIEFVQNTVPLHDYLLPAHEQYFPKDYKSNHCRKLISDAAGKKLEDRVKAYKNVTQNFHPVMRFFFMERFFDPDIWFQKRLNYSRSTAAISMLGHVLGVGDRHGHNILLDTKNAEVVHIDLGVAFEAGRVLPIPEQVPFRLSRDIVDGFGVSGVEGSFRRCCEFTLSALRTNEDMIMTTLDVLRWDPLHNWSVSPLRVARMQENENEREAAEKGSTNGNTGTPGSPDRRVGAGVDYKGIGGGNEPGEADRALAVVAKKLSTTLSVEATVNELIRQAMDEKNLASLFCGWAAYV